MQCADVRLDALSALDYADFDLIVLDPPYKRAPKSWGQGEYIGAAACRDAREFCSAVMAHARGSVWLWDDPDSDLVRMAIEQGARVRPFPGVRNRQEAHEVLCEIRRIPDAGLPPLFAWARQKGLAI